MPPAPLPSHEIERLRSLKAYHVLDTSPDPRLDALTHLTAKLFDVPIALVSLVDESRKWYKSAVGLETGGETIRDVAFCAYALLQPDRPLVVEDASLDWRFSDNPYVTGPPGIRFYAGVPLVDDAGHALGTLCIIDMRPRSLSASELELLRDVAEGVCSALELGRTLAALRESEEHYRSAVELSAQIAWTADPEGRNTGIGSRWRTLVGMRPNETVDESWLRAIHPDDAEATHQEWLRSLVSGDSLDQECRFRLADGSYRWFRACAAARRDAAAGPVVGWYGSLEDMHSRKLAELALLRSERFSRSILETSPDCIKVLDLEGRVVFINGPGLRLQGVDRPEAIVGRVWTRLVPAEYSRQLQTALAAVLQAGGAGMRCDFTAFCPTASGAPAWWEVSVSRLTGQYDEPTTFLLISRDVTQAKRAADEIAVSAARLSAALESTTDSVIVLDYDWQLTYANQRAVDQLSGGRQVMGAAIWSAYPELVGTDFERTCREAMRKQAACEYEGILPRTGMTLQAHLFPAPEALTIFFRDISERRRIQRERLAWEDRIAHLARHDPLTGLGNRLLFHERFGEALARDENSGETGTPRCALLWLDLDRFKAVNDTLGHAVGDAVLLRVAERLSSCVRSSDLVARLGGDEFAVLQPGADGAAAAALARRIVGVFADPFAVEGQLVSIGVSVGIALAPDHGAEADMLLRHADTALYRAKSEGRGGWRSFEPEMDASLLTQRAMKTALREALARGEFELAYQPILDLRTGRLASFEALLRWRHPAEGVVMPDGFLTLAEDMGAIVPIGRWVLEQACREAARWPGGIGVAVNLSAVQFRADDLVRTVAGAIAGAGLEPHRLELEITEAVSLAEGAPEIGTLQALQGMGLRIALDDFGIGHSSLSYLRRFAFDTLKIDRSFVGELPDSGESSAIVRAITGLGRSLGIAVSAEGVETAQQLDLLRLQGCSHAQGYFIGAPIPPGEVLPLLARYPATSAGREAAGAARALAGRAQP